MLTRLTAAAAQELDQRPAAVAVKLAHHVVEQHQGRRAARSRDASRSASSSASRASRCCALGAVGAQLAAVAGSDELVAVGPVPGEAALEVAVDALGQLGPSSSARSRCDRGR